MPLEHGHRLLHGGVGGSRGLLLTPNDPAVVGVVAYGFPGGCGPPVMEVWGLEQGDARRGGTHPGVCRGSRCVRIVERSRRPNDQARELIGAAPKMGSSVLNSDERSRSIRGSSSGQDRSIVCGLEARMRAQHKA
jgi:hypothetical protein